jgi:hypothetical protein
MKPHRRLGWLGLLCGFAAILHAHDPGTSVAQGQVRADAIELDTGFAPGDVQPFLPPELRRSGRMTAVEFDRVRQALEAVAPETWAVRAGGVMLTPREVRVELLAGDNVNFRLVFPRPPAGVDRVTLRAAKLGALPPGHREFVIAADEQGLTVAKKLLSAGDDTIEVPLAAIAMKAASEGAVAPTPASGSFAGRRVASIWNGYGRWLLLMAVVLIVTSLFASRRGRGSK